MSLDVKLDTATTTGSIPQEQGKLKVKLSESTDPTLTLKDVKQVFRKINATGSETELVWEISTPPDTSITTQDNPPINQCGVCRRNQLRYWPILPTSGSNARWDCVIWSDTGRLVDLIATGVLFRDPDVPAPATAEYYADAAIVATNSSSFFLPPPPNHLLMDYATYALSDRIVVVDNTGYAQLASDIPELLPANPAFAGFLDAKYRIKCMNFEGSGSIAISALVCNLEPQPPLISEVPLCACSGGGLCNETTEVIEKVGSICRTLEEIIDDSYANKIIDSGCINTTPSGSDIYSVECETPSCNVCHGYPALFTNTLGDNNLSGTQMHHRQVGYLPNVLLGNYADLSGIEEYIIREAIFDSAYKFTDLAIINDDGCNVEDCPLAEHEGNPPRCPGSAWNARIFLPFYVNVPTNHTDLMAGDTVSLYGKRIRFSKQGDTTPPPHPLYLNNATRYAIYRNYPPLTQMSHLINGYIRASCIVLGNEYSFITDTYNPNKLVWGVVGYPHYDINTGLPSHSHQVVLQLGSPENGDDCNECWFSTPLIPEGGVEAIQQGPSINLNRFVLYPITNSGGTRYIREFNEMITSNLQTYSSTVGGIEGINSLRIFNNIFDETQQFDFKTLNGEIYVDTFKGSAVTTTAPVPCGNILATIQQPPIIHPDGINTDCQCLPL